MTDSTIGLESYRKLLIAARLELHSSFRAKFDSLIGPGGAGLDDLAAAFNDQFIAQRVNRLDCLRLKLVDAALSRVAGGSYGACLDCGNSIPGRRLEAIPWAELCVACQEREGSLNRDAEFAESRWAARDDDRRFGEKKKAGRIIHSPGLKAKGRLEKAGGKAG